ncbi:Phospholipase A1 PLIP1, chloroplastic-like protein [Drosera capensis]
MACSPAKISSSGAPLMKRGGLRHSPSAEELRKPLATVRMQRSSSESNLVCFNQIHAAYTLPKTKNNLLFSFNLSSSVLPGPLRSLLPESEDNSDIKLVQGFNHGDDDDLEFEVEKNRKIKRSNWIERVLELRRQWMSGQERKIMDAYGEEGQDDDGEDVCEVDDDDDDDDEASESFVSETFSALLTKASWVDTKRFSHLAFLCNMAYAITELKDSDLRRYYDLRLRTSSLKKKAEAISLKAELDRDYAGVEGPEPTLGSPSKNLNQKRAYDIAASAASNCRSRAKGPKSCSREDIDEPRDKEVLYSKSEMASFVAASTMTSMVAAKEKEKEQVVKDLKSLHSSPCEWFICDHPRTHTRYFVIQGSDSLASWQANLLFEPTEFEGTEMVVHRGMYEAAKGIYEQFMPEIKQHLEAHGDDAKLQFTGHSLGGSLSLLIHLMLVARGVVKPSSLLPVTTFGSPFVFCGGKKVLSQLGVDESQVHCVIMHRDIVPRAFTCDYPNHVAQILKRLNGSFRSHPCLKKKKLLYAPLGKIFILQPEDKISPPHPLLPPGTALYELDKTKSKSTGSAFRAFLNNPHPLETLSDPAAYGSEGTILRDHDSSNYLMAVNGVLKQSTKMVVRRVRKERQGLWPLLTSPARRRWSLECEEKTRRMEMLTHV